ncbi:MAG: tetratricopeptide repeat protein [Planctomicrobium sp.]|nr:tetratricopeptide repeat protein [Planctomicrobium sp.]
MCKYILYAIIAFVGSTHFAVANEENLKEAEGELQAGNYESAQKWFNKLIEDPTTDSKLLIPAYFGMSRTFSEVGQYGEAIALLEMSVERLPESSRLWARLGQVHYQTGELARARREIQRALDLDSQDLLALLINAQLLTEKSEIDKATTEYRAFVRIYNRLQPTDWQTLLTIGEGAAIYARWESVSQIFRFVVNTLCPDALKDNEQCWQAYVLSGNLLLEKYNEGQALPEFHSALEINSNCVPALVAMGRASLQNSKFDLAEDFAERALKINAKSVAALQVKAVVQILLENESAARETLQLALAVNPKDQESLGYLAAIEILQNAEVTQQQYEELLSGEEESIPEADDSAFIKIWRDLTLRNASPGLFLEALGSTLDARRKYDLAEVFYRKAIELMPQLAGPQTSLGMLYMRTGRIEKAEEILQAAFKADPFHVRVSNMRKVIGVLKSYEAIDSDHFVVRAAEKDLLLAKMISEYLEEIYPELTERYGFEPPVRSQFEIYSEAKDQSGHAWFSTRMIGLPWIQTVGASTGKIVALTSPNESEKKFNWMRVVRHEFVHVLTLQKTNFNIPHWFTEAISVTEENIEMPVDWQLLLLKRFDKETLFNLSNLNNGFQKPEGPDDWTLAYCQSFLYAQHLQNEFGEEALRKLLDAYQTTSSTEVAFQKAFSASLDDFEEEYQKFIERKVRSVRHGRKPDRLSIEAAQQLVNNSPEDAAAHAQFAFAMFQRIGLEESVIEEVQAALALNDKEPLANAIEAIALLTADEHAEALRVLERSDVSSTQDPFFLQVQAKAFEANGRISEAEDVLKLIVARFPLETKYQEELLKLYDEHLPESDEIQSLLETLASRDYDDIPSRKRLAKRATTKNELATAIQWSSEAIAVDSLDTSMHRILAESLYANKEYKRAVRAYENLMFLDQVTVEDQLAFAKLLRKQKQRPRAESVLRKLLNEDPQHKEAKTLLEIIESGL